MSRKRKYFVAGGESLAIAEAFLAKREEASETLRSMMVAIGASEATWSDTGVTSVRFSPEASRPEGLTQKRNGTWSPGRSAAGRAIAAQWKAIRDPSVSKFTRELFPDIRFIGFEAPDLREVHFALCWRVGEKMIISMPEFVERVPPGATAIKRSEYHAMVEAEEERTKLEQATRDGALYNRRPSDCLTETP